MRGFTLPLRTDILTAYSAPICWDEYHVFVNTPIPVLLVPSTQVSLTGLADIMPYSEFIDFIRGSSINITV